MIQCQDISKAYRGRPVLNGLTFSIETGICALLGPNGAGKSTLLKLLTGLERPDGGSLRIAGLDLVQNPMQVRQLIGVLPDQLGLFEGLTLQENLETLGPIYGITRQQTHARTASLLAMLDLETTRHTFAGDASYGMKKKTALAMALLHNPRVLLLDEPFEGIDPTSSRIIEQALTTAAQRGLTILFTSHILPLAQRFANRSLILQNGVIVWDSSRDAQLASLDRTYFNLIGEPGQEDSLPWLGC
jgi:ABC-2 type transport system ATP-binding protein